MKKEKQTFTYELPVEIRSAFTINLTTERKITAEEAKELISMNLEFLQKDKYSVLKGEKNNRVEFFTDDFTENIIVDIDETGDAELTESEMDKFLDDYEEIEKAAV